MRRKFGRRKAVVSRKPSPSPTPTVAITDPTSNEKGSSQRRLATCSSRSLEAAKKAAASLSNKRLQPEPIDILFDKSGNQVIDSEGNLRFQRLISWYYSEKYRFAETGTHRSIIRSAVFDEIKTTGMKFFKLNPFDGDDDTYILMDDKEAMRKIKNAFVEERFNATMVPGRSPVSDSFNSSSSSGLRWSTQSEF
eukprot:CAMPEP_0204614580 /NCGR_PEP_ID=MMETSP0717-20131115/2278_1 /ASSEMBLY_ACC=CAM_ASM_000666 /TAXON_ID=230516 /ORGANISM="Chaetoceros curvisetus" /LENGTH=193 /DNA_ID=CAMNT_0051627287 /DNA_START=29 /DNA_END=610 /DNA_ORIENTATION=-